MKVFSFLFLLIAFILEVSSDPLKYTCNATVALPTNN